MYEPRYLLNFMTSQKMSSIPIYQLFFPDYFNSPVLLSVDQDINTYQYKATVLIRRAELHRLENEKPINPLENYPTLYVPIPHPLISVLMRVSRLNNSTRRDIQFTQKYYQIERIKHTDTFHDKYNNEYFVVELFLASKKEDMPTVTIPYTDTNATENFTESLLISILRDIDSRIFTAYNTHENNKLFRENL